MKRLRFVLSGALVLGLPGHAPAGFSQELPHTVVDPGVITTHQAITPAGIVSVFRGRAYAVNFCGSDDALTTVVAEEKNLTLYLIDARTNKVLASYHGTGQYPGMQSLGCGAGNAATLVGTESGVLLLDNSLMRSVTVGLGGSPDISAGSAASYAFRTQTMLSGGLGSGSVGGMTFSGDGKRAALALTGSDELAILDVERRSVTRKIVVGIAPFNAVLNHDGTTAWVSNMGDAAKSDRWSAKTGSGQREDALEIDQRGIASAGTVMRVDLESGKVTDTLIAGLHPTALAWDVAHDRLFVANGNSDSITVIDTQALRTLATWKLQPFARNVRGIAPTALALAPDGARLYVACGGINAIALVDTKTGKIEGLIPTAWYPASIALNASGTLMAVDALLGVGSGYNPNPDALRFLREAMPGLQVGITRRYVHSYRGTVQVIAIPDWAQLARYTAVVSENNHLPLSLPAAVLPERVPAFGHINHIVYIVKENRSYDQLFGDLGIGNGDPSLELYGEDVTPNQRALARQFVLLDNFYATGGNSGDGHQWVTQSNESEYAMEWLYGGRSYPFDGNDPLAYAGGGFLWDSVQQSRRTFADFGEFIPTSQVPDAKKDPKRTWNAYRQRLFEAWRKGDSFEGRFNVNSPIPRLDANLVRDFPPFDLEVPDVVRARIFLRHLKQWEDRGGMPSLTFLQLPSDHTSGINPGDRTPQACVADNDLALGEIVEGLTHSRFWPHMAIFVVEDDAQGGVDHVDGHRTIALAISPYVRRSSIDSTMYSHPSIAKTIEMMLGLRNLSLFDLIANDMRNGFTEKPDLTPYTSVTPKQSLFEINPPLLGLSGQKRKDAIASSRMNWSIPDAAPARDLLDILWRNAKGYNRAVPHQQDAVFLPYSPSGDDDEGDSPHAVRHSSGGAKSAHQAGAQE